MAGLIGANRRARAAGRVGNGNRLKHGLYTKAAVAERKRIAALVRDAEAVLGALSGHSL